MNDYKFILETTDWEDNTPNHIYLLDSKDKAVGYVKNGQANVHMFAKPMMFSRSRRKFRKLTAKEKAKLQWQV